MAACDGPRRHPRLPACVCACVCVCACASKAGPGRRRTGQGECARPSQSPPPAFLPRLAFTLPRPSPVPMEEPIRPHLFPQRGRRSGAGARCLETQIGLATTATPRSHRPSVAVTPVTLRSIAAISISSTGSSAASHLQGPPSLFPVRSYWPFPRSPLHPALTPVESIPPSL